MSNDKQQDQNFKKYFEKLSAVEDHGMRSMMLVVEPTTAWKKRGSGSIKMITPESTRLQREIYLKTFVKLIRVVQEEAVDKKLSDSRANWTQYGDKHLRHFLHLPGNNEMSPPLDWSGQAAAMQRNRFWIGKAMKALAVYGSALANLWRLCDFPLWYQVVQVLLRLRSSWETDDVWRMNVVRVWKL